MIEETAWPGAFQIAVSSVAAFIQNPEAWLQDARENAPATGPLKERVLQELDDIEKVVPFFVFFKGNWPLT